MNKNRNGKAGKIGHPWLSTLSLYKQLGSFSNDDVDGKKNGMHLKINTSAIVTLCDCPILFAFYNVGKGSYNWTGVCAVELNTENSRFTVESSSCHQNGRCGHFTLLFCRGRHGLVHKRVPHVQRTTTQILNLWRCRCSSRRRC